MHHLSRICRVTDQLQCERSEFDFTSTTSGDGVSEISPTRSLRWEISQTIDIAELWRHHIKLYSHRLINVIMAPRDDPKFSALTGFDVLPITLPAHRLLPQSATHYMYLKQHEPKIPDSATPRSLFVVNVPIDSTHSHLRNLFSIQIGLPAGRIADVEIHDRHEPHSSTPSIVPSLPSLPTNTSNRKRKRDQIIIDDLPSLDTSLPSVWDRKIYHPGTNAVIVFVDKTSMEAALKAARTFASSGRKIVWGEGLAQSVQPLGSSRYKKHVELLYPEPYELAQLADEYLSAFDAHIAAKEKILAEQRNIPDEDGFITVTRTSSKGGVRGVKQDVAKERLEKQKKRQEELSDFYRFQGREKAKQRARELVSKFHEDVEKVKKMRQRRGRMRVE